LVFSCLQELIVEGVEWRRMTTHSNPLFRPLGTLSKLLVSRDHVFLRAFSEVVLEDAPREDREQLIDALCVVFEAKGKLARMVAWLAARDAAESTSHTTLFRGLQFSLTLEVWHSLTRRAEVIPCSFPSFLRLQC
jgi:hypothetical protein